MSKSVTVAAVVAILIAEPALAGPWTQGQTYNGPMIFQGGAPPIYNGTMQTVSPGTSYSPNYQYNNPGNMMRMTTPNVYSPYGYGSGYGYNVPYGGGYGYGTPYGMYGAPALIGGSNFGISVGGRNLNFWRAPSGYYYPWANNTTGYSNTTVLQVQGGTTQQANPPITTVLGDMIKYMDTQHSDGKLADGDFQSMKRRALDLQSKTQDLMVQQNGVLDPDSEQQIRRDIDALGAQLSHRVQP